jgi:hypothetical protein
MPSKDDMLKAFFTETVPEVLDTLRLRNVMTKAQEYPGRYFEHFVIPIP